MQSSKVATGCARWRSGQPDISALCLLVAAPSLPSSVPVSLRFDSQGPFWLHGGSTCITQDSLPISRSFTIISATQSTLPDSREWDPDTLGATVAPLICCVTLGKSLSLSELQVLPLQDEMRHSPLRAGAELPQGGKEGG